MIPIDKAKNLVKNASFKAGPEMSSDMWSEIAKAQDPSTIEGLTSRIRHRLKVVSKYGAIAGVAAVLVFGVVYFGGFACDTSRVYAAAMTALEKVRSVHISGWTTNSDTGSYETMDLSQRYPLNIWEWVDDNNDFRRYYQEGHTTEWDNGKRQYKYNQKKDQLGISPSRSQGPDFLPHYPSVRGRLEQLRGKGYETIELGRRQIGEREAMGWRFVKKNNTAEDLWVDVHSNLILEIQEHVRRDERWQQLAHGNFVYDQEIPPHVRNYTVPDTDNISYDSRIDPSFEKWNRRLQQIASYYQEHPLPETMELLERTSENAFDAITAGRGRIPGIKSFSVKPVTWYLDDFLRNRVRPRGSLRVPTELRKIELNYDLVVRDGQTMTDEVHFVLDVLELDLIESVEQRQIWVAHYDGRPLKPWQQVKAPVPRGESRHTMPGMDRSSNRTTMPRLFDGFVYYQDYDLRANKILIIDETGLSRKDSSGEDLYVSSASPYWRGDECVEMARQWFKEQFGVTFTEETRPMTVYTVQRR